MEKSTVQSTHHTLNLKDKKILCIDCVINVIGFDESYLQLSTKSGNIGIEGKELKIESLTKEDGKILITGEISGIFYYDEKPKRTLGKIFK